MKRLASLDELEALSRRLAQKAGDTPHLLRVCGGTGCRASRAPELIEALRRQIDKQHLSHKVSIRMTGCLGFCEQGPIVVVEPENIFYCHVTPEDAGEIVSLTIGKGALVERLLYRDPLTGVALRTEGDIPFFKSQDRRILGLNRLVDPRSIEDYFAVGGYSALAKVLSRMTPEGVIDEIKRSGLRGRGGAGYPTGLKWEACRKANGARKHVVCNADEGDPGAYMDRSVLEGNPHLVLEGMLIGAWAIGAQDGYIYVRHEYPLAVEHVREALAQARAYGLLGENILDSGFSFDVQVVRGAGAFVCGEATALMASIEGKVGEPRPKDVHTVEKGLWDEPSNLNNVETWANVPLIIKNGSSWFAAQGTEKSKGTKIFALTGRVKNTGLVEVAMGTPLQKIVYEIGGGASNGSRIKAVQTGGPSGGCLPAELFHLPVDFETLSAAGSMVGSGGMVVMDETTCMVDVAKYFLEFLHEESCGKCVPCRLGIDRMLEILTDISEGRGRQDHIPLLEDLADTVAQTSLCGLGKTAPNPVLSTLRYFRDEYERHILDKKCPAKVCRSLIRYEIDERRCEGCTTCVRVCPAGAISGVEKQPHTIDQGACIRCGICRLECRFEAISVD